MFSCLYAQLLVYVQSHFFNKKHHMLNNVKTVEHIAGLYVLHCTHVQVSRVPWLHHALTFYQAPCISHAMNVEKLGGAGYIGSGVD